MLRTAPRCVLLLALCAPAFLACATSTSDVRAARGAAGAQAEALTWSPHDVETLRAVGSAVIAPDGRQVAYTQVVPRTAWKDEDGAPWTELHVLDVESGAARPFVTGKTNVGRVAWMPDSKTIAYLAKRDGDKETALWAIRTDGGESRKVAAIEGTSISAFSFSPDGREVALVATEPLAKARKEREEKGFKQQVYEEDDRFARVWIAETREGAGAPRKLEVEGHVHQCVWSPTDARLALAVAPTPLVDDEYMRTRVRVVDSKDGTVLRRIENPGKLGTIGWTPDAKWIAMIAASDLNDPAATTFRAHASGTDYGTESIQPLPDEWEGAAVAFAFQPDGHALLVAAKGCETSFEKVNVANRGEQKTLVAPGVAIFGSVSLSKDGQVAAFVGHTPKHPPELWTMRHGDAAPTRRTITNPALEELSFARQEVVRWKARDGLLLEGVLVRPANEEPGRRYPLILSVHGGPEAHDSNGWVTNYSRPGQIAAARGFAVLYPNYRGSTGRGVAFQKSSQADPAGREFDDLVDAVDHLVSIGLVDRAKVGVTGGSYGGYATAWCSTKLTERFAAGVMFVGIADKFSKFGTTDIPEEEFHVHALKRVWDAPEFARERSPITYAAQSKTPLLVLHGKDDPRVDPGQSRTMYRHMKLRSQAPVRLVLYPGEGHGNRKAAARLDYALRMFQWFEHYLQGPGGEMPPYEVVYTKPAAVSG
ncbi:MAG: S9 family peptidase [Planctomycetes bacterium]|nr:S9 family peptidase [Planctomycetota bacterium]